MNLTVACVEWGDYQGCGRAYVLRLRSMVERHLSLPHDFVVLSDRPWAPHRLDPGMQGWWNKVQLFKPGQFEGRVMFFDLDTVIVGNLDALAACKGIIHLKDWGWQKNDYCSSTMVWDAGEHERIYTEFRADVPARFPGDQDWITHLGGWEALPFPLLCSAKYHCRPLPPAGAAVVSFHGNRKPHHRPDHPVVAAHWH